MMIVTDPKTGLKIECSPSEYLEIAKMIAGDTQTAQEPGGVGVAEIPIDDSSYDEPPPYSPDYKSGGRRYRSPSRRRSRRDLTRMEQDVYDILKDHQYVKAQALQAYLGLSRGQIEECFESLRSKNIPVLGVQGRGHTLPKSAREGRAGRMGIRTLEDLGIESEFEILTSDEQH